MRNGTKVKIITRDRASYGEVGTVIGKQMTVFGMMYEIDFPDRVTNGLYSASDLRQIEDKEE